MSGQPASPLVLHIPHASREIPSEVRAALRLDDSALALELDRMTDTATDKLFQFEDAQRLVYPWSRLVVDPERFTDDEGEPMASRGMGVVYTHTSAGGVLREPPSATERSSLLGRYYEPHHRALAAAVGTALASYAKCIVVDCHSFPSVPLAYEPIQDPDRPDLCIGADDYHTPGNLVAAVRDKAESLGLTVAINNPFVGALVPLEAYRKNKSVFAVMLELNRRLYMDEHTCHLLPAFDEVREKVSELLETIRSANSELRDHSGETAGPG